MEREYDKFSKKIFDEKVNIIQDKKQLDEMLRTQPSDDPRLTELENFIKDSNNLIEKFTELRTHIADSLSVFDKLNIRRKILKQLIDRQTIQPIITRTASLHDLKQIKHEFPETHNTNRRPNSAKNPKKLERHFHFTGGKRARTRKNKKTRSRK